MLEQFADWSELATTGGALTAVLFLTQVTKNVKFIQKIPTQILSFVLSIIVMVAATYYTNGQDVNQLGLTLLNAGLVALAANGGYSAITRISSETSNAEIGEDNDDENL